jgi:hypothetical protein
MWQIDLGVAIALVYNFVLFSCIPMTQSDLIDMHVNLRGRSYDISLHDFGVVLPLLVVFTFVMFVLPVVRWLCCCEYCHPGAASI